MTRMRKMAGSRHQLRSLNRRTMAARNSGIPAPVREDVTNNSGKAAGWVASAACGGGSAFFKFRRLDLIGLGQDHLIAHGRFVERLQDVEDRLP